MKTPLVKQFLGTAGIQLLSRVIAVLLGVIYARFLGPDQYGLYGYALSVLALLTLPVTAGLPNFIIREVANFQLEKKCCYLAGIINWSRYYVLITSSISMLALGFLLYIDIFEVYVSTLLMFAVFLIPFRGLLTQQSAILNGLRMPIFAQIPVQILSPLLILLTLSFFIFNQYEITGVLLIKISIITSIMACLLSGYFLKRIINNNSKKEKPQYAVKKWHKSLKPFTLMAIVGSLNSELSTIFLGWLDTTESVAFFKVAMQGTLLITLGLSSINSVIMPQVARLYKQGDLIQTQLLLTKSVRLSCLISLPVILVLVLFGDLLIEILFGKAYLPAYPLLVILCVGQAVNVIMGSVGLVLNMTNNEKYTLRTLAITLCILTILLVVLIPLYSGVGAAISVSIGMIIWNVLMTLDMRRLTGLRPSLGLKKNSKT